MPTRPATAARRCLLTLLAAVAVLAPATADAALRSPHLTRTCDDGFTYAEQRIGPWIVEGCGQDGAPRDGETARRRYHGEIEVNGMLCIPEVGDEPIVFITTPGESALESSRVTMRRNARTNLLLDARIGDTTRRFTIFSGDLEIVGRATQRVESFSAPGYEPLYGSTQAVRMTSAERTSSVTGGGVLTHSGQPLRAAPATLGRTEIPVGTGNTLLGLRLARDLDEVLLTDRGMEFPATLKLGLAAGLLADAAGSADIELVDGQGMTITDLRFRIGRIAIPGVGGLNSFRVTYSERDDAWGGGFDLDLGDLFPGLDFAATVSATTGVPTSMRLEVEPLNIPLGQTGIVLQSVRAGFILDPLTLSGGAGVTAGPQIAGASIIRANGDLTIALEPNFRMEAGGSVRILPVGSNELANGSMDFVLDSSGLISLRSRAEYRATALGLGVSANIHGDGAYSSTSNAFNIGAGATGRLELGFLGGVDVIELGAVVSSDGWGTCGPVFPFVSAGIGQEWDRGLDLILGCDLSPYRVNVARASTARRAQNGVRTAQFTVPDGLRVLSLELTADRIGPRVRLLDPEGNAVVTTGATGRQISDQAAWFTDDQQPRQVIFLRQPKAGRWTAQTLASDPQITQVRSAVPADPITGRVDVTTNAKSGRRKAVLRAISGVYTGEQLRFGVKTPAGITPIAARVIVPDRPDATKWELSEFDAAKNILSAGPPGDREIVVQVLRGGIPIPGRTATLARYRVNAPQLPARLLVRQKGRRLELLARAKRGTPAPQAWEYRITTNDGTVSFLRRPGKPLKLALPARGVRGKIVVRPVVDGRIAKGAGLTRRLRADLR